MPVNPPAVSGIITNNPIDIPMAPFRPIRPLRINETSPRGIAIDWNDERQTRHTYRNLRFQCQCAYCREEMTGRELIRLEDVPEDIHPLKIIPVGTYALRFDWSDGHSTGIYAFDLLLELAESEGSK